MFLLRSIFWLTIAFLVVRPETDMRDTAATLSSEAMARGSQFVAAQIESIECQDLSCVGGKAVLTAVLPVSPPAGTTMHVSPAVDLVPLPRPRPDRAG
jgi:hypothetical protein